LNTAGIGITRCSRDLRCFRANETDAMIAGLPLEEIIGRPIVEAMGEAACVTICPCIERVLLASECIEYESELPFAGGAKMAVFRVVCVSDRVADGFVTNWIACISDITATSSLSADPSSAMRFWRWQARRL